MKLQPRGELGERRPKAHEVLGAAEEVAGFDPRTLFSAADRQQCIEACRQAAGSYERLRLGFEYLTLFPKESSHLRLEEEAEALRGDNALRGMEAWFYIKAFFPEEEFTAPGSIFSLGSGPAEQLAKLWCLFPERRGELAEKAKLLLPVKKVGYSRRINKELAWLRSIDFRAYDEQKAVFSPQMEQVLVELKDRLQMENASSAIELGFITTVLLADEAELSNDYQIHTVFKAPLAGASELPVRSLV